MGKANRGSSPRKAINFGEILPEDWNKPGDKCFVRAFSMAGVARRGLSPPVHVVLGDVCVLMAWLALPRLSIDGGFEIRPDGKLNFELTSADKDSRHPAGPVALFIVSPALSATPREALIRADDVIAQLTTLGSLFLAFEHVEDYWINYPGNGLSGAAKVILDTTWWDTPVVSSDAQEKWKLVQQAIADSEEPDRLWLSLRWIDEAKRSTGTDAFLKLWFALEILTASTDDKVVSRINRALRAAYEIDQSEVGPEFAIGRIFGLRGKVVHHGLKVDLSGRFLNYLAGVYIDLLVSMLGFQVPGRANASRDEAGGIDNLLPFVIGGRSEKAVAEEAAKTEQEHQQGVDTRPK